MKSRLFKEGFSLDETKVSLIMVTYALGCIEVFILSWLSKPIPGVLNELLLAQLTAITGFNITKAIRGDDGLMDVVPVDSEKAQG